MTCKSREICSARMYVLVHRLAFVVGGAARSQQVHHPGLHGRTRTEATPGRSAGLTSPGGEPLWAIFLSSAALLRQHATFCLLAVVGRELPAFI